MFFSETVHRSCPDRAGVSFVLQNYEIKLTYPPFCIFSFEMLIVWETFVEHPFNVSSTNSRKGKDEDLI